MRAQSRGGEKTAGSRDKPVSHSDHIRSVGTHWSTASLMGFAPQGCEAGQMTYRHRGRQGRKAGRKEGRMEDGASCLSCAICPNNSRAVMNGNPDCIMHQLRTTAIPPLTCDVHRCSTLGTCVRAQGSSRKHVASISHQITYILNNTAHMLMRDVTPSRL